MLNDLELHIYNLYKANCIKREENTQKMLNLSFWEEIFHWSKVNQIFVESKVLHAEFVLIWDLMKTHDIIYKLSNNSSTPIEPIIPPKWS